MEDREKKIKISESVLLKWDIRDGIFALKNTNNKVSFFDHKENLIFLVDYYLIIFEKAIKLCNIDMKMCQNILIFNFENLASSLIFFFGCLVYFIDISPYIDNNINYECLFLLTFLYLLVDNYIDNSNIDENIKNQNILRMKEILNPKSSKFNEQYKPRFIKLLENIYNKLVSIYPKSKKFIKLLFESEIDSISVQKSEYFCYQTYLNMAYEKGGRTLMVLYSIVGIDNEEIKVESFDLGIIMQLIDDSLDVFLDKKNNICTVATYHLDVYGNLDLLWFEIMDKISKISSKFQLYSFIYTLMAIYLPKKLPDVYSNDIKFLISKYDCLNFEKNISFEDLLLEIFFDKIKKNFHITVPT